MKYTFVFSSIIIILACSHSVQRLQEKRLPGGFEPIGEIQAIDIALQIAKEKNPHVKEFISKASFENSKWFVLIQFVMDYSQKGEPLFEVGGHCVVTLDEAGNLLDYFSGL